MLRERRRERKRERQTDRQRGRERQREKQRKHETQGYNSVADRWTEASNPHPHPNLNPHTQASRPLVFPLFHSVGQTDQ